MTTRLESLHFDADSKLQDFIHKKTAGFNRIFEGIESCDVVLKLDKDSKNKNKVVEVSLNVPQKKLFAKDQAETFELATDMVVDELKQQLKRYKDKLKSM